jgi:hypothetical protein
VSAAGEQAQHASGIGRIQGLTEDLAIHNHDRVGAKDKIMRPLACDGQRFFPRQPLSKRSRQFPFPRDFRDVRRLDNERNARVPQQLLAARGG